MNIFRLRIELERHGFPAGIPDLLRSDISGLEPPRWADRIEPAAGDEAPDALLLVLSGPPSAPVRRAFFEHYRSDLPIACLCYGDIPEGDQVVGKLRSADLCFGFSSPATLRKVASEQVQDWIGGLRRESLPFPEGRALMESFGDLSSSPVDSGTLERAREVLARRGFVCLSGPLGAGKTTMARKLLAEAWQEGLNPVEVITRDLDQEEVEHLLTGTEDCAVFLDLDTVRRMVGIYPPRLWSVVLSMITRTTEARRRLILATSSDMLAGLFDHYSEAHVRLPAPAENRQWRLVQGRETLEWFRSLEPLRMAELLLMAAFDPVVPEAVFRRTLYSLWKRLLVQGSHVFPSREELEERYGATMACRGEPPFRRLAGDGTTYISSMDTLMMWSVDEGIRGLLEQHSPVVRAFAETLFDSHEPLVRRAGYFLAELYPSLSDEVRTKLLLHVAEEQSRENLLDVLNMLLSSPDHADTAVRSMCAGLMKRGSDDVRRTLAEALGKPWLVNSDDMSEIVEQAVTDDDPGVRGRFMYGLTMWGLSGRGEELYARLLEDESEDVRRSAMIYIGSRFPDLSPREFDILNSVLETGGPRLLGFLTWGLLDRRLEDFSEEFHDLLWVLMDRLSSGGKGRLAWQIGARLRFFSREVRSTLREELTDEDVLPVARCMLMNYASLDEDERRTLWEIVRERAAGDRAFASMVLSYFSVMETDAGRELLRELLSSEQNGGREALSQLVRKGRSDLARLSSEVIHEILDSGEVEQRMWLPFFVMWNDEELPGGGGRCIRRMVADASPLVRKEAARAVGLLGERDAAGLEVVGVLSTDEARAVRAAAAEALGEIWDPVEPAVRTLVEALLGDADSYVRARMLRGLLANPEITPEALAEPIVAALGDRSAEVRLEAVSGLSGLPEVCALEDVQDELADRLADPDGGVRLETVKLVTGNPELMRSDPLRTRIPDILLDRLATGTALADELNMARKIQLELLPDTPPSPERFDIEVFYRPAREVGGDYYDFFMLPGHNLGMAVADVVGKGIPAALTMASLKGNLEAYVQSIYGIDEIVRRVNVSSVAAEADPILTGMFYSVLDLDSGNLTYVNAGHNPPLLVRREGRVSLLGEGGLILGLDPDSDYEFRSVRLEPGDVLVMYTDGVTEAMDAQSREMGGERLEEVVLESRDLSAGRIVSRVMEEVRAHTAGAPQSDDQTLVVVKYR